MLVVAGAAATIALAGATSPAAALKGDAAADTQVASPKVDSTTSSKTLAVEIWPAANGWALEDQCAALEGLANYYWEQGMEAAEADDGDELTHNGERLENTIEQALDAGCAVSSPS